ncbi:MAG TPA: ABC transporter permease [Solirubrobacteraceae bacterium]|jgi:ABC transporter DrrB family efflux protein|nr:ABC transporter permease [Solirubrobacteraceae bacterium]
MSSYEYVVRASSDTFALLYRNVLRYRRMPDVIVFLVIQPLIVLLLFRYILGGAIRLPGISYVDYLMPGVFGMAIVIGSSTIGIGLAEDLASGTVDHLRALPIARSALLVARTFTDIARNLLVIPLIGLLGVAVGFNMTATLPNLLLAYALLLALGFAFAWISTTVALWTSSVEATQGLVILVALTASFASSGFAPVATMPHWLRGSINASPVTYVDNAVRVLITSASGPIAHDVVLALVWIVGIVAVMVPLSVMRYARHLR